MTKQRKNFILDRTQTDKSRSRDANRAWERSSQDYFYTYN